MINISGRNASSNKLPPILIERSSIFTCPQPTKGVQQPADTLVRWTSSKPACHSCSWRSCSLGFSIDPIQSNPQLLPEIPPSQIELFDFIIFYLMCFLQFWIAFLQCAFPSLLYPLGFFLVCQIELLPDPAGFLWERINIWPAAVFVVSCPKIPEFFSFGFPEKSESYRWSTSYFGFHGLTMKVSVYSRSQKSYK